MRPLGALIFGMLADRYGRRRPLMANVIFFSTVELLCGFAPNFTVFFILRLLFGIGMGGEWGVGASLAMEHAPVKWRGVLSGILQSGYSNGYLLAAIAARVVLPNFGWRAMFWVGGIPALLALYIRTKVPESEAWQQHRVARTIDGPKIAMQHKRLVLYMVALMFLMNCLSHGTQDLYPDFLKHGHGIAANTVAYVTMFYNVGAVVGAVIFGLLSERIGRRYSMLCALGLSLLVMPAWAFGGTLIVLALGAFVMQMGVQGAWGIIPVHLNELSPGSVRGLLPGFTYQIGISAGSRNSDRRVRSARPPRLPLGAHCVRTGGDCRTHAAAVLRPRKSRQELPARMHRVAKHSGPLGLGFRSRLRR